MKKTLIASAAVLCAALVFIPQAARSQLPGKGGPFGPGDKGAQFKAPWEMAPGAPSSGTPASPLSGLLNQSASARPANTASSLLPYQGTNINQDILVTKDVGPWMILVMSYSGPEAAQRARKFVEIARTNYKLPAYVFNYGAEEKAKELERVRKLIEERKEALKKEGLDTTLPIRVKVAHIDEHVGILIGGFPTQEAAAKYNKEQLRKVEPSPKLFMIKQEG